MLFVPVSRATHIAIPSSEQNKARKWTLNALPVNKRPYFSPHTEKGQRVDLDWVSKGTILCALS